MRFAITNQAEQQSAAGTFQNKGIVPKWG